MNIKTETWNGHSIRFAEREPGDWWAVLADIATALRLKAKRIRERLPKEVVSNVPLPTAGGPQEITRVLVPSAQNTMVAGPWCSTP